MFVNARDQSVLDNQVLPTLEELGVEPVEVGVVDAPADDQAALAANIQTIAERFEAADADTVVLVGLSAQDWPANMDDDPSYRPRLLFLDAQAGRAYSLNAATTDTSVLEGSLAAGSYGPSQAVYEKPAMQDCIARLADHGVETPAPDSVGGGPNNQPFAGSFNACADLTLLQAWLEAAGEDLNYGTLQAAWTAASSSSCPGRRIPAPTARRRMRTVTRRPISSSGIPDVSDFCFDRGVVGPGRPIFLCCPGRGGCLLRCGATERSPRCRRLPPLPSVVGQAPLGA